MEITPVSQVITINPIPEYAYHVDSLRIQMVDTPMPDGAGAALVAFFRKGRLQVEVASAAANATVDVIDDVQTMYGNCEIHWGEGYGEPDFGNVGPLTSGIEFSWTSLDGELGGTIGSITEPGDFVFELTGDNVIPSGDIRVYVGFASPDNPGLILAQSVDVRCTITVA